MTDTNERASFFQRAQPRPKGIPYEGFNIGRVIEHHWGRTIGEAENTWFSTMTLNANPTYFNAEYARALGHPRVPLHPHLIYLTVFGMSVEDLTEGGTFGALVGMEDLKFHAPGYPGDTFVARSTVLARRPSSKRPDTGLVTWRTEGFNQDSTLVVDYVRTNMMNIRS
jgi:acyl dehydratase